jgi:hypothetical protein
MPCGDISDNYIVQNLLLLDNFFSTQNDLLTRLCTEIEMLRETLIILPWEIGRCPTF